MAHLILSLEKRLIPLTVTVSKCRIGFSNTVFNGGLLVCCQMHQVAVSMVSLLQSLDASVAVGLALIRLLVEDALFAIAIIAL